MKQTTRKRLAANTNQPAFVSIRDQKKRQQLSKAQPQSASICSAKQMRPHKPLARQEKSTEEIKRARLPLYHPSRFR